MAETGPPRRLTAGQRVGHLCPVTVGVKLVTVDNLGQGPGRVQQPGRDAAAGPPARVLVLEDEQSLARLAESGFPVSVQVKDDGPSTDVHVAMRLPGGRVISAEVDAGSDQLILNQALAAEAGVDLAAEAVRTIEGLDETGHSFAAP